MDLFTFVDSDSNFEDDLDSNKKEKNPIIIKEHSTLKELFGDDGILKSEFSKDINNFIIYFNKIRENIKDFVNFDFTDKKIYLLVSPTVLPEDYNYILNLINKSFEEQTGQEKRYDYWNNLLSSFLSTFIYNSILLPTFNIIRSKSKLKITQKDFKTYLEALLKESEKINKNVYNLLYILFLLEFGNTVSKKKSIKQLSKKTEAKPTSIYTRGRFSEKYNIPDYTSMIYRTINMTPKIKSLFNECKQILLLEYNMQRSTGNKRDKTIFNAKVKDVSFEDTTKKDQTIMKMVIIPDDKEMKFIPDFFSINKFYITVDKSDYYYVQGKKVDTSNKELTIEFINPINPDDQKEYKEKFFNNNITCADTFGKQYDLKANPKWWSWSKILTKITNNKDKLKKTSDVIGLTGDNSIWKTAMGDTLSAITGDFGKIFDIWTNTDDDGLKSKIKTDTDNLIRFNILNMFKVYLKEIKKVSSIKKDVKDSLVPMSSNITDYDYYVIWIQEVTNYIMSEFYNDNDYNNNKELLKKYIKKRNFFDISEFKKDKTTVESSYYDIIKNINHIIETRSRLRPSGYAEQNKEADPKAIEIIGIDNDRVIDDFIDYLVSIKVIK